jgi:hypothetical protein
VSDNEAVVTPPGPRVVGEGRPKAEAKMSGTAPEKKPCQIQTAAMNDITVAVTGASLTVR